MAVTRRDILEEQYLIEMELKERRSSDPLIAFKAHDKQQMIMDSILDKKHKIYCIFAANRSGKTDLGAWVDSYLLRHGWPDEPGRPINIWVVSKDFDTSRDIVQPKMFNNGNISSNTHPPFIPDYELLSGSAGWSKSNKILYLKNRSICGFKSAASGRKSFEGVEREIIHFDEIPPREVFEECVIRVGSKHKLIIIITATVVPSEEQAWDVTWVYDTLVNNPKMDGIVKSFTMSIYDNPYIDKDEIATYEAIYPVGTLMNRIRLRGEWLSGLTGARVYSAFDPVSHVIDEIEVLPRLPLAWMWDFNVSPMVSLVGQYYNGIFHVIKEFYKDPGNIPEMCKSFKDEFQEHDGEVQIFGDVSGNQRDPNLGKSYYQYVLENMATHPMPVTLNLPNINPFVVDRINSTNRAFKDGIGMLGIQIDKSCENLIKDYMQVETDGKGKIKKIYDARVPYSKRTHCSDAVDYWIYKIRPLVMSAHLTSQQNLETIIDTTPPVYFADN